MENNIRLFIIIFNIAQTAVWRRKIHGLKAELDKASQLLLAIVQVRDLEKLRLEDGCKIAEKKFRGIQKELLA